MGEAKRKAVTREAELTKDFFAGWTKDQIEACASDAQRLTNRIMASFNEATAGYGVAGLSQEACAARVMMVLPYVLGYVAAGVAAPARDAGFLDRNWLNIQRESSRQFQVAFMLATGGSH